MKWQYEVQAIAVEQLPAILAQKGADGWELCGMASILVAPVIALNGGPVPGYHLVFKRPDPSFTLECDQERKVLGVRGLKWDELKP